jgi:hypothetical protein
MSIDEFVLKQFALQHSMLEIVLQEQIRLRAMLTNENMSTIRADIDARLTSTFESTLDEFKAHLNFTPKS